jgi:tRNA(Met) C34 N-acetyltransferase TmcA
MQVVALNLILDTMMLTEASIAILGNKEDFEALTLNLLARTIETVEGGGLIILLPSLRPDSQRHRALVSSDAVATLRLKFIRSRRAEPSITSMQANDHVHDQWSAQFPCPIIILVVNTVNVMPALFRRNPRRSVTAVNITTHV